MCTSVLHMLPLNNVTRNLKDTIRVVEIQEIRESPFRAIIFIESGSSYRHVNIRFFFYCVSFTPDDDVEAKNLIIVPPCRFRYKFIFHILQMKAAYRVLDTFCELPNETRAKYERVSPDNHGYVKPGTEK